MKVTGTEKSGMVLSLTAVMVLSLVGTARAGSVEHTWDTPSDGVHGWVDHYGGAWVAIERDATTSYLGAGSMKLTSRSDWYPLLRNDFDGGIDLSGVSDTYIDMALKFEDGPLPPLDYVLLQIGNGDPVGEVWKVLPAELAAATPDANGWYRIHMELGAGGGATSSGSWIGENQTSLSDCYSKPGPMSSTDWTNITHASLVIRENPYTTARTYWVDEFVIPEPSSSVRTWSVDASGDWNQAGNWSPMSSPKDNTHTAVFGSAITGQRAVYTEIAVTVKTVQFDNANTYAITGPGSVNLEADSGNASLDVDQGDHEFQARVNLNSNTDADIAAGAKLSFVHVLSLNGNTLTKTGDGTLSINSTLNTGGGSVVGLGGTITGGGAVGGNLTNTSATIAPGNSPGTLTVTGDFSQAAGGTLAIELAGTASGEFDVLAVTGFAALGGALDITELYTPGGADSWTILTAVGGITGSFDTITAGYQVALAGGDTELVLSLAGALLPGDANGDGCVDDLDLTALAVHWQQSTNLWEDGDFDGNGIVNDLDLTALAVNWQQGCGGGGSFADALAAANVPEPVTLLSLALGGIALVRRRR